MKNIERRLFSVVLLFAILWSCNDVELESELIDITPDEKIRSKNLINYTCSFDYGMDDVGNPIGGSIGYDNIVSKNDAHYIVNNLDNLQVALENASNGEIVYIEDNAVIEMGDEKTILIPSGVTLASGRGNSYGSCGGLIVANANTAIDGIKFIGDNARVTGIRFEGPSGEYEQSIPHYLYRHGINTNGKNNLTVDNCEIYNWTYSGVVVGGNSYQNINIFNNNFYSIRGEGLGYGVVVGGEGFALIKGNRFYQNRHDIGSSGVRGSGYEASYNYFEGAGHSHNVDVHGGKDHGWTGEDSDIAGKFTYIHHNVFDNNNDNIKLRGIPTYLCIIENNIFKRSSINNAINHSYGEDITYKENIFAWNNVYDWDGNKGNYKGLYMSKNWKNISNNTYLSFEDDELMKYQLGDFDGDGKMEIFKSVKGAWYIADIPTPNNYSNYRNWEWKKINSSGKSVEQLGFGDFDGNGTTDVFNANGQDWYVSYGGSSGWSLLNSNTTTTLNKLRFGDFNNDGKTDVFKTNAEGWHVSYGGSSVWTRINSSSKSVEQLGFGDFDGNGTTDVFSANGQDWYVSYGGNSGWQHLGASGETIDKLFFGTLDNSGIIGDKTNIFTKKSCLLSNS